GGLHAPNIRRDVLEGQKNGVTSTPTFFIGPSPTMGGPLKALRVMTGAQPYASFKEVIDDVLEAVPTS
ncbi:MAG: DsbA family protein, partial [Chthoniobacterales bacterium]